MRLGFRPGGKVQRPAGLLLIFLVLGVLTPCACVLWFMNEAARTQSDSARRTVLEAYRGQLWLLRDRLEKDWAERAASLQPIASDAAGSEFQRIVNNRIADSVILLNGAGAVVYPSPAPPPADDPAVDRAEWRAAEAMERRQDRLAAPAYAYLAKSEQNPVLAARAAQAQVRCLVQAGKKDAALEAIEHYFGNLRTPLAADEQLFSLHLMTTAGPRYADALARLVSLVNDYRAAIPSAHRLFLMDELRTLDRSVAFPTYDGERLAAEFLNAEKPKPGDGALEATRVSGLWKLTAANGHAVALYRTNTVVAAMGPLPGTSQSPAKFSLTPPSSSESGESIAAGPLLPGWKIALTLPDAALFDDAARRRVVSYVWVGSLVIAAIAIAGVLAAQTYRRQLRIARLKTDLVAAVSHELKTPLASMRLLLDVLLDEEHPETQQTRDYLTLISRENQRLSRLIENFLTFSRLERNREKFDFRATDPGAVVQSAVEATAERFHGAACHLEVNTDRDLPSLRADEDALVTVLLNLLDNAYKYTTGDKRIELRTFCRDGRVVFAVEDNGVGIAPRDQKRIFRRFYQVDRRLSRETGGCGLGLSIVEFIVKAHGGTVEVKSHPGKGSTFSVVLPAVAVVRGAVA